MSVESWRQWEGTTLEVTGSLRQVRLQQLLSVAPQTVFLAEADGTTTRLAVRLQPENQAAGPVRERYLEAAFLDHPNLLRYFGAGALDVEGVRHVFAVFQQPQAYLVDLLREGPLQREQVRVLGRELAAGLRYLHEHGLVYCHLDPQTVAWTGSNWALADFAQLRPAGSGYAQETRRLMAHSPGTPPEAFEGLVTPAWDTWGLASLVIAAMKPGGRAGTTPRHAAPEAVALIGGKCLTADPHSRCGLDRLEELLDALPGTEAQPVPSVIATPAVAPPVIDRPVRLAEPAPVRAAPDQPSDSQPLFRYSSQPEQPLAPAGHRSRSALVAVGLLAGVILLAGTFARTKQEVRTPIERAPVPPAEDPATTSTVSEATAPPVGTTTRPSPVIAARSQSPVSGAASSTDAAAIQSVLDRWTKATRQLNLNDQTSLYTPRLEAFYKSRGVPREAVLRERERAFDAIDEVRQFDISALDVQVNGPDRAIATFDKTWNFAGDRPSSGKTRSQLGLRKVDGTWRIASEKDVKVYWVKRG